MYSFKIALYIYKISLEKTSVIEFPKSPGWHLSSSSNNFPPLCFRDHLLYKTLIMPRHFLLSQLQLCLASFQNTISNPLLPCSGPQLSQLLMHIYASKPYIHPSEATPQNHLEKKKISLQILRPRISKSGNRLSLRGIYIKKKVSRWFCCTA